MAPRSTEERQRSGWVGLGLAVASALAIGLACSDSSGTGNGPQYILVAPDSVRLNRFANVQLNVAVLDKDSALLTGVAVTFLSNDTAIATVTSLGVVASVGPIGSTSIRVTAATLHKNVPVTVTSLPAVIEVSPEDTAVHLAGTYTLRSTVRDFFSDSLPNAARTFSTADSSVATISATGLVTAKGVGLTALTVASTGLFRSATVRVHDTSPYAIDVSPADTSVHEGGTFILRTTVRDYFGDSVANASRTFQAADTSVATISASGLVTAKKKGQTSLQVQSGAVNAFASVTVLDSNIVARVALADAPYGVAASTAGVVYVAPILGPSVRRLNMVNFTLTDDIPVGGNPAQIAFNGTGTIALVTKRAAGSIGIIDVATHAQVDTIDVPGEPYPIRVTGDGSTAYVAAGGWLFKVSVGAKLVVDSVAASSTQLTLGPGDSLLYFSSGGVVTEVRTSTMAVVRTFTTGGIAQGLVVSQDGTELYIADEVGPLRIWSLASGTEIDTVSTGGGTFGVALTADGTGLFVGTTGGKILRIDRVSRAIVHTIDAGGTPRNIAVDPVTGYAIVPNEAGNWIDVVK